ncbi:phosphatidylglycerol lysyltransferase domain-containing protein [Mariniblastus fucicola]|uniref:Phosphatidylglycerol lysyltransferase n=1 Tax=Mariniblastus fucicola TaxID=980251 RepID=A0A5B9PEU0_9BACT|nr:phosphatidylglycerol lysyltransferase domain-containing protein [Mariniblastus fucicola]QEG24049.1 Phosphatidylglycerol lysyltransferase [Mariniblastus fucicola]
MNHFKKSESSAPSGTKYLAFAEDQLPLEFRLQIVRRYGSETLSFASAIQSGLCHFANQSGYLAFQKKYGHTFVLGDPVVAPHEMDSIIDEFLKQHRNVTFCQISESVAGKLNRRKYWVNELGFDSRLDLDSYDFAGKEKERFRYASNWLNRRGFEIRELELTDDVQGEIRDLNEQWIGTRTVRKETAFLNRPMEFINQPDVRRFFLVDAAGKIQAFVFFDPMYLNDQVIGYVTTFKRRHPDAPSVAEQGICKEAIETFKREGKAVVRLGLSPFAGISDDRFRYNWLLKYVLRYYYRAGWVNRYFFNLRGHAEFKKRFRGENEKAYFASPGWVNDVRLFALIRLCKIL